MMKTTKHNPRIPFDRMDEKYHRILERWHNRAVLAGVKDPFEDSGWVEAMERWVEYVFLSNGWTEAEFRKEQRARKWKVYHSCPEIAPDGFFSPVDNSIN